MENTERPTWIKYLQGAQWGLANAIGCYVSMEGVYPRIDVNRYNRRAVEALRPILPYCLHTMTENDTSFIWLNRDYKPLGVMPFGEFVFYEDYTWLHVEKTNPQIDFILKECKVDEGIYWFFDDITSPVHGKKYAQMLLSIISRVVGKQ